MDRKTLVEKIRRVVKDFSNGRGDYSLVMLIPSDPAALDSKVALLVSAPWLDEESPSEVIYEIIMCLREVLGASRLGYIIQAVVPARTSDPTVRAINSAYIVTDNETVELINVNAAGRQLDKATILESRQV